MASRADPAVMRAGPGARWRSYHIFHNDRDRVLRELVAPTAAALLADGQILSFFFVRYDLGGPHVRFRLLPHGSAHAAAARLRRAAAIFFRGCPTPPGTVDPDAVRRLNRGLARGDPFARGFEDAVYPSDSVIKFPAMFEIDRYGGPDVFEPSLVCFAHSSAAALALLRGGSGHSTSGRLSEAARVLVRLAWALAHHETEFRSLVAYGLGFFGPLLARFGHLADEEFDRRPSAYTALLRTELERLATAGRGPHDAPGLVEAARYLSVAIQHLADDDRLRIKSSHLHMTANRVGLRNGEEVYLARLLLRAADLLARAEPSWWGGMWRAHEAWSASPHVPGEHQRLPSPPLEQL